ncbi:MAG: hypothetical protein QM270_08890 [Bacillota bacterium]|nr:hypothetical protein [Bacillota bacterium]
MLDPNRRYRGEYAESADTVIQIIAYTAAVISAILAVISAFVLQGDWIVPVMLGGLAVALIVAGYAASAHLNLQIEQTRMLHYIVENMVVRESEDNMFIGLR